MPPSPGRRLSTPRPDNLIDAGDVLVVGAGLGGLYTALKLAPLRVSVVTPTDLGRAASSLWAQGGIAAALDDSDSPEDHAADTIAAGAGLVDEEIALMIAREARGRIEDLMQLGVPFDRGAEGRLSLGREGAHRHNRIARVTGDKAGAAIMRTVIEAARACPTIRILTGFHVQELALKQGRVAGAFARRGNDTYLIEAPETVLATGGIGGLYEVTTNPLAVRGEGFAMAARAGATIADPEFVQFHPTAIDIGRDPAPLATEALRGEGAKLVDSDSARIMEGLHPLLELAPRDVVARAIHAAREAGRRVFLDCRESVGAAFPERFPTVYATCIGAGIDPVTDPIPVAPAAHYHMGGIAVDRDGRADIAGLWACGECAATGAHGANRLASNSLLEALVYGHRIAEAVRAASPAPRGQSADPPRSDHRAVEEEEHLRHAASVVRLRRLMTRDVGLLRDGPGLARALAEIDEIEDMSRKTPGEAGVLANMIAAARLTAAAAFARRESRGGHTRTDYPKADDGAARRSFLTLADAALIGDEAAKGPAATG